MRDKKPSFNIAAGFIRFFLVTVISHHNHITSNWSVNGAVETPTNQLKLHFYELKPYIYFEGNQWKGILADFIGEVVRQDRQCWHDFIEHGHGYKIPPQTPNMSTEYHLTNLLNMTHKYANRTDFINHNRQYIKAGRHQNETTLWFPVLGTSELPVYSADSVDVAYGDTLAPVVLRETLDLLSRVNRTTKMLLGPFLLSILVLVAAAIVLRILVGKK